MFSAKYSPQTSIIKISIYTNIFYIFTMNCASERKGGGTPEMKRKTLEELSYVLS